MPSQVALAPGGGWHGEQLDPQVSVEVLDAQASPQRCHPEKHDHPHEPEAQAPKAFEGAGQGVQRAPHVAGSSSRTQAPLQSW